MIRCVTSIQKVDIMTKIAQYLEDEIVAGFVPMIEGMEAAFVETLAAYFGEFEVIEIILAAREHFNEARTILPNVGPSSPWLKNLIGIAYEIGLWKELVLREFSLREISILNQETLALLSKKSISPDNRDKIGCTISSVAYVTKIAEHSRGTEYSDDWVFDCIVPNVGDDFHVGMNVYKCPISTLCKRLHVEDYFPYICLNDYVTHGMLGISLVRTQTLAHGAPYCDFRLTQTGKPEMTIITDPSQLSEFSGSSRTSGSAL